MKLELAQEWGLKLKYKYNIYWAISEICGIPKMLWYGMEGWYNVIVLSRLGSIFKELAQLSVLSANMVFSYTEQMVFSPCA